MPKRKKPEAVRARPLLTPSQCSIILKAMRDFGYPSLTLDRVESIAAQVAAGTHSPRDAIALIMCKQIDEAVQDVESLTRQKGKR